MTTRPVRHVAELDSIRGVALVLVVLCHLWIVWPTWTFAKAFSGGGFVGVDLFFVLSGFLITALLLDEQARTGAVRLASFYWRRALRLLPALWFFLAAYLVYAVVADYPPFGRSSDDWQSIRAGLTFGMNWHVLWHPLNTADLTPLWSLSIEAQFYVLWPLVVLTLVGLHRSPRTTVLAIAALFAAVSVWRLVLFERHGWETAYLRSDSHIDGLLLGSLVACAWVRRWTPDRLPRWLLWAGWGLAGGVFLVIRADDRFAYAGGTTLFLLGSATVVLVAMSSGDRQPGPLGRATGLLGRWSYGLYLWHFPVFWASTRWGRGWSDEARFASACAVTTVGVVVSHYLVERPALRLKRRSTPAPWTPRTFSGPSADRAGQSPG